MKAPDSVRKECPDPHRTLLTSKTEIPNSVPARTAHPTEKGPRLTPRADPYPEDLSPKADDPFGTQTPQGSHTQTPRRPHPSRKKDSVSDRDSPSARIGASQSLQRDPLTLTAQGTGPSTQHTEREALSPQKRRPVLPASQKEEPCPRSKRTPLCREEVPKATWFSLGHGSEPPQLLWPQLCPSGP